jgi:hypothetical protein
MLLNMALFFYMYFYFGFIYFDENHVDFIIIRVRITKFRRLSQSIIEFLCKRDMDLAYRDILEYIYIYIYIYIYNLHLLQFLMFLNMLLIFSVIFMMLLGILNFHIEYRFY